MSVRSTAKAIIIDNDKVLLNKCYDKFNGNYYSLPGGGQDKYESIYDAVIRECKEETGYNVTPVRFCGICEEICDNEETRKFYSQYAHKLYHIFIWRLLSVPSPFPVLPPPVPALALQALPWTLSLPSDSALPSLALRRVPCTLAACPGPWKPPHPRSSPGPCLLPPVFLSTSGL